MRRLLQVNECVLAVRMTAQPPVLDSIHKHVIDKRILGFWSVSMILSGALA